MTRHFRPRQHKAGGNQRSLIDRAIHATGGSQAKLAEVAGISQQHISQIMTGKQGITAEVAIALDRATSGAVPRWETRPDLWKVGDPMPPAVAVATPAAAGTPDTGVANSPKLTPPKPVRRVQHELAAACDRYAEDQKFRAYQAAFHLNAAVPNLRNAAALVHAWNEFADVMGIERA